MFGLAGDRFGAKRVLVIGLFAQALGAGAYFFVRQLGEFYAVAAVFGLIYGGIMPLYAVIAREYFPMRIMGTVIGASTVFSAGGMALGPAVGGWDIRHHRQLGWLYIASFGIGLGAMAIALLFPPFPSQRPVSSRPRPGRVEPPQENAAGGQRPSRLPVLLGRRLTWISRPRSAGPPSATSALSSS